jgi:hypothetical protein
MTQKGGQIGSQMNDKQIEAMVTQALERRPVVRVPEDFAAKVAARLPAVQARHVLRPRFSVARVAAMMAMAVLTIVLFAIAPHVRTTGFSVSFGIEMLLLVELAGIVYGLTRLRESGL